MGCASSRLDDLPAVALCRERCKYLDQTLLSGHAFADATSAYSDSLRPLAPTLHSFFSDHLHLHSNADEKKTKNKPNSSSDSSESHLRLPPESDDGGDSEKDDRSKYSLSEDETRRLIAQNFGFSNNGGGDGGGWKPPPSPPPAALGSAWDFLNLFDTFEKYERIYAASSEPEKVKPDGAGKVAGEEGKSETTTYEARVVEETAKKEVSEKVSHDSAESTSPSCALSDAMSEIKTLFIRASESGNEVLKWVTYRHKITTQNQDSFRLCVDEDIGLSSVNLSTTLKKLSLWEKKLYCEVKAEEKLRIVHHKKLQELKWLEKENPKSHKANSARASVRDLTTKLKIAFQIVDRISIAINKVRDDELWPQIKELHHRLLPMWKTMLECHKSQSQRVAGVKGLDFFTLSEKLSDADAKAAIHLKLEFQTWNLSFSGWVTAQKDYINALNGWLTRCLLYEPEETPDGVMPFSPGRLGAPPLFVVCNHWSQAIETLLEKEVTGAIQGFLARIDALLREHNVDVQQILVSDKEIERRFKMLERHEQKILKAKGINIGALSQSEVVGCGDLQQGLRQIFTALEKFMASSVQAYEELRVRIEEVEEKPTSGAGFGKCPF